VTLDPLPYPANTDFVPVPADFVTERGVWQHLPSQTDPSRALAPIRQKTLRRFWIESVDPAILRDSLFPAVAATNPPASVSQGTLIGSFYYIWNRGLYIVPSPSPAGITLTLDYVRLLPDMTGTQSNWFTTYTADVVRAGAVAEAYRMLQLADASTIWEQTFQSRLTEAINQDSTLALSGPQAARGGGGSRTGT